MAKNLTSFILLLSSLTLSSCAGIFTNETCIVDLAGAQIIRLQDWDVSSDNNSSEFNQPVDLEGIVEMGARGNLLGTEGSIAVNNFDCGKEGSKCWIEISAGVFDDGEKLVVKVTKDSKTLKSISLGRATRMPQSFTVESCEDLKIVLKVTTGYHPGLKSKHRVTVNTSCVDC